MRKKLSVNSGYKWYIESILEEIKNYEPSQRQRFVWNIIKKAASKCIKKIRNRIRKISIELTNAGVKLEALSNDESMIILGFGSQLGSLMGFVIILLYDMKDLGQATLFLGLEFKKSHVYKYGRTLYYLGKIQRIHFKSNRSQTRQRVAHTRSNSLPTAKAVAI